MRVKIWQVSQLNAYIRDMLDKDILLRSFFAEGEISNVKQHSSGHIYFTLKDQKAALNCVMFKTYTESLSTPLREGAKVIVCGYISFYEKSGQIQLYAEMIEPVGAGRLYASFEQLKEKLRQEGLFQEARKRPLPSLPRTIALITSPTGAAVQDMIQIARRRNPGIRLVVIPVQVQGQSAPADLTAALRRANAWGQADIIIIGRGGGSLEDLWAFNDEMVVRAVATSRIPVISAVGHETDFTLTDFAADRRAPTPSAAAELAVPELWPIRSAIEAMTQRLADMMETRLHGARHSLESMAGRNVMQNALGPVRQKWRTLLNLYEHLHREAALSLASRQNQLAHATRNLENISPLRVVGRGYGLVQDAAGQVITDSKALSIGDAFRLRMRDGVIGALVTEEEAESQNGKEKTEL